MDLKQKLTEIYDVFSRRDVSGASKNKSDKISGCLRSRVLLLYRDVVSARWNSGHLATEHEFWQEMHNSLQHLYGRPKLSNYDADDVTEDTFKFLLSCNTGEFFDFIELSFKLDCTWRAIEDEDQLVEAINKILGIENAPYRLTNFSRIVEPMVNRRGPPPWDRVRIIAYPKVIRTDDEAIHREAIEPALSILNVPNFTEADLRFREALDHYRKAEYDDCLTKCGSSLESVLKAICKKKGWTYSEGENLSKVLQTVIDKSGLEPFYKDPLTIVATIRNRLSSSHGRGTTVRTVQPHVAQFTLNSTAAAILLLVHQCNP